MKKSIKLNQLNQFKLTDYVLVDIRSPQEYVEGHIPNAINLYFYDPKYKSTIALFDKNKTYVLYCGTECRVNEAYGDLLVAGIKDIFILEGGYSTWVQYQNDK